MSKLSYRARKRLPSSAFALPGRHYPIPDKSHARNALARASQFASPDDRSIIENTVARRFPSIAVAGHKKRSKRKGARS